MISELTKMAIIVIPNQMGTLAVATYKAAEVELRQPSTMFNLVRSLFEGHSHDQGHSHSHSHSHGDGGGAAGSGGWTNENVHLYEQQPIAAEIGDKSVRSCTPYPHF